MIIYKLCLSISVTKYLYSQTFLLNYKRHFLAQRKSAQPRKYIFNSVESQKHPVKSHKAFKITDQKIKLNNDILYQPQTEKTYNMISLFLSSI